MPEMVTLRWSEYQSLLLNKTERDHFSKRLSEAYNELVKGARLMEEKTKDPNTVTAEHGEWIARNRAQ